MDRLDFSKSINIDPVVQVRCFFNETMTMYNLSEGLNYSCIKGSIDDKDNSIQFSVEFGSENEAATAGGGLIGKNVSMYSQFFHIRGSVTGRELLLIFDKIEM